MNRTASETVATREKKKLALHVFGETRPVSGILCISHWRDQVR